MLFSIFNVKKKKKNTLEDKDRDRHGAAWYNMDGIAYEKGEFETRKHGERSKKKDTEDMKRVKKQKGETNQCP